MSDSNRVATNDNEARRARIGGIFFVFWLVALSGCSGNSATEPLVEFSTEINVTGARPQSLTRQLRAGEYLVEVRERDIDLRVQLEGAGTRRELADAYLRHGVHRTVVRLERPGPLRINLLSTDQRAWRGSAAVRILRWPPAPVDAPPDRRYLGFVALGHANELIARSDPEEWRVALRPLREAATHFEIAGDVPTLAETEYQAGWLQYALLKDSENARRYAEAAQAHFEMAGDATGKHRAARLRALTEFEIAASMGPEVRQSEQRALLDGAAERLELARRHFAREGLATDEHESLGDMATRAVRLGDFDNAARLYEEALRLAAVRGDRLHEAMYRRGLGVVTAHRGEIGKAVSMFEGALAHLERERTPVLYAQAISSLGDALVALGQFDRAQMLHTEALDVFAARGDERQAAAENLALAAIQFRSGDVERALASAESALPRFWRIRDFQGLTSALRLAGNAASEIGRHDKALDYLRRAEFNDRNPLSLEHTRVLIAGELRETGDLRNAERVLTKLVTSRNDAIRAAALAERGQLRRQQDRLADAIADLRAADMIYARLGLDFNRIDTSAALAMALLAGGDAAAAAKAADTAIAIETRIRVSSANPELRARFLEASYAPYEARIAADLAGLSAYDPDALWRAFGVAESLRARSLTDRLLSGSRRGPSRDETDEHLRAKLTGLQMDLERQMHRGALHDEEIAKTRRELDETRARIEVRMVKQRGLRASGQLRLPESREAVQAMLPADTAVLAYFVGDNRSHAWLLTRRDLKHAALPGRVEIEHLVKQVVDWQRNGKSGPPDVAASTLLGGLLDDVRATRLLVLPDGPLNRLPFAALPLPGGGGRDQLIDRFVIGSAPSLAIALRPAEAPDGERLRVAVISDPVYTPDDRRLALASAPLPNYRGAASGGDLARLAYSAIEARAVVQAFQGADVIELAGFNATARRVIELPSEDLDVLHFATHALAREDMPGQSALFLSEYAADGSPLQMDRLTADDIARNGLRADLVVLSGCATGDGRQLRGEGVLGLTHGFLGNGSNTVVSSLWPVEDALTARFMEEFYSAYRASGRAAEALRVAQLRSRDSGGATVWASFVVRASGLP